MERMMVVAALVSLSASLTMLTGCEEQCAAVETRYNSALSTSEINLEEGELDGDRPAQFGIALKADIISQITNIVLKPTLNAALKVASTIQIRGQSVDLSSRGDLVQVIVEPDGACDNCFRIGGDLGGQLIADIPILGRQTANLRGSLSLVAPIILTAGEESAGAVKLDLQQLAQVGQSSIATNLSGIDPDWARLIESPLSDLLLNSVTRDLEPFTLLEFNAPTFGIPNFRVLPVELRTDRRTNTVFAGFATNLPILGTDARGVEAITDLRDEENIAFAFQPSIVSDALSLLMFGDQVARSYSLGGTAQEDGPARVITQGFLVGEEARPPGGLRGQEMGMADAGFTSDMGMTGTTRMELGPQVGLPISLGFNVFNIPTGDDFCFSFGASAFGSVSVVDNELDVRLDDLRFTNETLQDTVPIQQWTNAEFITESRSIVTRSLDRSNVGVPGAQINFGGLGLEARPRAIVLRASSSALAE